MPGRMVSNNRSLSSSRKSVAKLHDPMLPPIRYSRNEQIFSEGDPAEFIYKVESGCVRSYKNSRNDRRQMIGFYVAGEYFGLEGGAGHAVSADATTPSMICMMKRKVFEATPQKKMFQHLLTTELHRAHNHNLLLLEGAQERVVNFLLDMAERGQGRTEIDLHMTRQDIADYLGLTIETVSRVLSRLENSSAISLSGPWRVVLRDLTLN